ncbi:hypothetical protein FRB99_002611, partial [Tulasnella sp. 403]
VKRIMSEARELRNDDSTEYCAAPLEEDIFEWHCTIRGPPDTEFEGGLYHCRILLPPEYPFKAPSIMILTPNGRFELNKKICISFTSYHEELWQPAWGVRTAIIGLQGFFPLKGEAAVGVGAVEYPIAERKRLAALFVASSGSIMTLLISILFALRSRSWTCPDCGVPNIELLPDPPSKPIASTSSHPESQLTETPNNETAPQHSFDQTTVPPPPNPQPASSPSTPNETTPLPLRIQPLHDGPTRPNPIMEPGPHVRVDVGQASASSTTSVLSLATLSPQDVKVLDAIIERVPPSATSFLDVFKAYNEVLQERGLDASQDVTFYRFLLKLGVLRGTWNERWATVKSGGGANTSNTSGNLTITGLSGQSRLPPVEDVTDDSITTTDLDEECDHGRSTPRQQAQDISSSRPIMPSSTSFARLDDKPATSTPGLRPRPTKPGHTPQQDDAISARPRSNYRTPTTRYEHDYDLDNRASSSSPSGPPSYKSYPIEPLPVRRSATLAHIPTAQTPSSSRDVPRDSSGSKTPRQPLSQTPPERRDVQIPPPRSLAEFAEAATRAGRLKLTPNSKKSASPGSGINAEETWKVLRMEREADDFRLYTLMRRCWDIWLGALKWNR